MNSRLLSIMRKEFLQAFRDRRTMVSVLIMPILQLCLLGYAAATDVKNIPLAVFGILIMGAAARRFHKTLE